MSTRLETHFGDRVVRCFADRPRSLYQLLMDAVQRNSDGEALICGQERLTYRALEERVALVAQGFALRGIGPGDRVALLLGNRTEFVVALLAAARIGAIAVPLNIREQKPELAYVLDHCGAALLIYEDALEERLPPVRQRVAASAFASLEVDGCGAVAEVQEEDTAAILYTSGTTGRPKGAMLSHLGIIHSAMHFEQHMRLGAADRSIAAVPLSHVTGVVALIASMLRCAGTLVVMAEFKAAAFLELAARERITHTVMVPAMYNLCLLQPDFDRFDLGAWRIGGYGGAPMPVPTIARFADKLPRLGLMNAYGATETSSPATMMRAEDTAAHGDSVGRAVACGEIAVMDDAGREVAPGEPGELWIKGPMVVRGYWNDPAATAREFTAGFWHSGDIGSVDPQGFVRVLDRKKDMINRGGYKVYCAEVESTLLGYPGVLEAAVVSMPCPVLGERVHAFITLAVDTAEEKEKALLKAYCAERLSDYKVPESFTVRSEPLPRNANGKVLKRELRQALLSVKNASE
jgi:acyl-CoA synthetase (AMP-forming)/AMP-acid ligase II